MNNNMDTEETQGTEGAAPAPQADHMEDQTQAEQTGGLSDDEPSGEDEGQPEGETPEADAAQGAADAAQGAADAAGAATEGSDPEPAEGGSEGDDAPSGE